MIISPSARTSTQLVFPPYRTVLFPGTGIEPRTPQNLICAEIDSRPAAGFGLGRRGISGRRRSIALESNSHVIGLSRYSSAPAWSALVQRSEEHTSELQSR